MTESLSLVFCDPGKPYMIFTDVYGYVYLVEHTQSYDGKAETIQHSISFQSTL